MTEDRVNQTLSRLFEGAQRAGLLVTGDWRVSEADAAQLLGLSQGHLAQLVDEDNGPPVYHLGAGRGSRKSYRLEDLARWIESRFESGQLGISPDNSGQRAGVRRRRRRA